MILVLSLVVRIIAQHTTLQHAAMKTHQNRICLQSTTSCAHCKVRQSVDRELARFLPFCFCGHAEGETTVHCATTGCYYLLPCIFDACQRMKHSLPAYGVRHTKRRHGCASRKSQMKCRIKDQQNCLTTPSGFAPVSFYTNADLEASHFCTLRQTTNH